jgi:hypothetical protein
MNPMTRRPREPLDSADELFLHRGLEGVAGTITSMTSGAGAARHAAATEHGLAPERAVCGKSASHAGTIRVGSFVAQAQLPERVAPHAPSRQRG